MEDRIDKHSLVDLLAQWNNFLKRKIHLIACGGTALTLQDIKPSTKDIDFIVPSDAEYKYLLKTLKELGYKQLTGSGWRGSGDPFIFDLFPGKCIHTTELLHSPMEDDKHIPFKEFSNLYIGILNHYDLICSKLFRGTRIDFDDCLMLYRAKKGQVDITHLKAHFKEMASYDISEEKIITNMTHFIDLLEQD